jgi:DNA-binding XRE family transcriptional regulator
MPNIAVVLKAEIARVARKELRGTAQSLKKAAADSRTDIAALKRRIGELEREVRRLSTRKPSAAAAGKAVEADDASPSGFRFSAKYLSAQRRRLGLSAVDAGLLVNASNQSIALWEKGEAFPRKKYLPALAALRTLGKRQIPGLIEQLKAAK